MLINYCSTSFTDPEREIVRALSLKLDFCAVNGARIDPVAYELLRRHAKGVNCEILGAFRDKGRWKFAVNDRPPKDLSQDPYACKIVLTGVSHGAFEPIVKARERLIRTELGGFVILWLSHAITEDIYDEGYPRAYYASIFQYARLKRIPSESLSDGIRIYSWDELPWERIIPSTTRRLRRWRSLPWWHRAKLIQLVPEAVMRWFPV